MTAADAKQQVASLLIAWCDSLLRLQLRLPGFETLDGGILCPACGAVHGRCHEAVYPLMCAARLTGKEIYLTAAKRLFAWGKNLQSADGSMRNDFKSEWKGVTVFAAIALHDALHEHGDLLTAEERVVWETRLSEMGAWLYENLTEQTRAYLNYHAANACAMALLGTYFSNPGYLLLAKRLAAYCLTHVTENGLIYGEGSPADARSPKGCLAIDIGYNTEETLPCLLRCANVLGDSQMQAQCRALWRAHLCWMLPDGAWDNSMGTRAFKWTYWGSRTADGCQAALFALGKEDPVFAEAAWRNLALLCRCTHNGLLCGGPDDFCNGEPVCVHHTFCHAKVLAAAIDAGIPAFNRTALPADRAPLLKPYPELDVCKAAYGKWRMSISGYDAAYSGAKHAGGGSISLLWHETAGPLIAAGMIGQTLREPHNQQLSVHPETWRSGCPRVETCGGKPGFGQHFCASAVLTAQKLPDGPMVRAETCLCSEDGQRMPGGECVLEYHLTEEALVITGRVEPAQAGHVRYVLPLIGQNAALEVLCGVLLGAPEEMFNLCPGFSGLEYRIGPDSAGCFRVKVAPEQP